MMMKNIYLCINSGRRVRDLLRLGLLDFLVSSGKVRIILLTPAYRVPEFVSEFKSDYLVHRPLFPFQPPRKLYYSVKLRDRFARNRYLADLWWSVENWLCPKNLAYEQLFEESPPALVVTANVMYYDDAQVIHQACMNGFRTLGLVRSWDNMFHCLPLRPHFLAVWNPVNKEEAVNIKSYRPQNVFVTGVPDFDLYFSPGAIVPREEFVHSLGLDPAKRILVYATSGGLKEETFLLDILLQAAAKERFAEPVEIICRLHPRPSSRLEHFWQYRNRPNVRLSFIDKYIKTLGWTMTREDVLQVANILYHADVFVTPGSTMMIEAAIFDTPTVVPVFSTVQPEDAQSLFSRVFAGHLKRIEEHDLVPIVHDVDQLIHWINRYLQDPTLYQEQRSQLVKDYVHFSDGQSSQRIADLILNLADA